LSAELGGAKAYNMTAFCLAELLSGIIFGFRPISALAEKTKTKSWLLIKEN